MTGPAKRTSLTAGSLLMTLGRVISLAASYALNVYLARSLGPDSFGLLGVILTVLAWAELGLAEGLPQWVVRIVERDDDRPIVPYVYLGGQLGMALAVSAVLALGAPLLASVFSQPNATGLFRIAAIDVPIFAVYQLLMAALLGLRAYGLQVASGNAYAVAKLAATVLLVQAGFSVLGGVAGSISASVAGLVAVVVLTAVGFRGRRLFGPKPAVVAQAADVASPSGNAWSGSIYPAIMLLAQSLALSADLWIVRATLPGANAGHYRAAGLIALVPIAVSSGLVWSLYAAYSDAHRRGDRERLRHYMSQTVRLVVALGGLWLALVVPTSRSLLVTIFGGDYAGGAVLLAALVVGTSIGLVAVVAAPTLIIEGRGRAVAIVSVLLVVAEIAAAAVLTPRIGAVGAAFSVAAVFTVGGVISWVAIRRLISFPVAPTLARLLVPAAAVMVAGYLVRPAPGITVFAWYVLFVAIWGVALLLTRGVTRDDLVAVREGLK